MEVHLVDGTYELFRHFFGAPPHLTADGREVGATRATVGSVLRMLEEGVTHVGVATDHVIESFRNDLWPTYKDGSGIDPALTSQFPLLEEVLEAAGICTMAMVEHEADDALAAMALRAAEDDAVERVVICTPDKDLAQCVGGKVVQMDRRKGTTIDTAGVEEKYGVPPASIPDWLGLVGDSADGFPGLPGWGAKSAAAVLRAFGRIEDIPDDPAHWHVKVRSAGALSATLEERRAEAMLFKRIATLELDAPVPTSVEALRWTGPRDDFAAVAAAIDAPGLAERAEALAASR
ncbi:flap endonuclease [Iamia sp. SCSIO 61187]|uniref:5'-3' exonuclease n=1 Tax=Iamia sp. SCSIO 61187 TaxID=2722752 RepID=UPI001C628100|nr:5'-3' exonuclease H3TH domain-containing protein [Iamia sp. SCSIO 61187]QYG94959.1 flap endonuclease [Iamia sp. SCSIO 61187]